ncbi:ABC transporter substrate-binding protein [Desulfonatronum sp. SC1]|uniref:substrate-binding periplasmic protein n=1 Tax=Desulfonatronum sp. SC1 TaxID=2109626 RepID=UPI000D321BC5|nr:transporter substrate-binding domain-containing protein [Desulfonatronum sp. SC1]PTN33913.1 hypothetical protein C6366_13575 [Desulfonatronum sp. SC1]
MSIALRASSLVEFVGSWEPKSGLYGGNAMKAKIVAVFYACIINMMTLSNVFAGEVLVYGLNAMPFCGVVDGKPVGIAVEILNEATNYGAPVFVFDMNVPWTRAQMQLQQPGNEMHAIIPFSRTTQREENFKWIGELIRTQYHIYSYGRPEPIKTMEEAQQLAVGVVRAHAIIPILERAGITNLDMAHDAEINALKLQAGRFDTIADSDFIALYNWKKIGQDTRELLVGPAIGEYTRVYIAASLNFPDEIAKRIADALEKMHSDGKMQEIINRWR